MSSGLETESGWYEPKNMKDRSIKGNGKDVTFVILAVLLIHQCLDLI